MRKKILFINPPTVIPAYASVMPPLGILYVHAYLRNKGLSADFIDLAIKINWERALREALITVKPEIIGISSNISNLSAAKEVAKTAKQYNKNVIVVVGGPLPSSSPELYLDENIDFAIKGEGEVPFYNFIKYGMPANGVCVKKNGVIVPTVEADPVKNLDELPFPSLDKIIIKSYFVNFYQKKPVSSIITSRGCPFSCSFCNKSVFGQQWRARSAQNVVDELKWQVNTLGVKEICIMDDNFTLDRQRAEEICDLILTEGLKFKWQCQNGLRAETLDEELLKKMKKSGCWKICIAPETGDETVLAKIDKRINLDDIRKINNLCRKIGICVHAFFMIGFPFEVKENIEKTIHFSIALNPVIADFAKVLPFPGTRLYKECGFTQVREGGLYNVRLDPEKEGLYKQAYLKFYSRPSKVMDILKNIGCRNFFHLFYYGVRIGLLN